MCVRYSEDEKKYSERNEGAQVTQLKPREPVCRKISMRQHVSSPRKDKS